MNSNLKFFCINFFIIILCGLSQNRDLNFNGEKKTANVVSFGTCRPILMKTLRRRRQNVVKFASSNRRRVDEDRFASVVVKTNLMLG